MMMKLSLQFLSFMGVIAVASAYSCSYCLLGEESFSNALYNKEYAIKVHVKKEIENPTPLNPQLPWRSSFYTATVDNIFKQENSDDLSEGEDIVVRGGLCQVSPYEETAYIVFSNSLHVMDDVPGFGRSKVLEMPSFCDYSATWESLSDERVQQLDQYKKNGETPCFEDDCNWEDVPFPPAVCPDGSSPHSTIVCEYDKMYKECNLDMVVDDCPPPVVADQSPIIFVQPQSRGWD